MNKLRLRVKDRRGEGGAEPEWREVALPRSVRALVLLNLQVSLYSCLPLLLLLLVVHSCFRCCHFTPALQGHTPMLVRWCCRAMAAGGTSGASLTTAT